MNLKNKLQSVLTGSVALLLLVALAGCRNLDKPGAASFASVNISGKTPQQIHEATIKVFQADGFAGGSVTQVEMRFQREGTRGETVAYGGLSDTYYGNYVAVRVKATLVDLGSGTYRLQCQAYVVRDAGNSVFEDATPLPPRKGKPYQKLLDKVAEELKFKS
jgi:hypothetical protein